MLSKCANPACFNRFRYFHEGRLFRMAMPSATDEPAAAKRSSSHIEFFWLCEDCKGELTLTFKAEVGVTTVPLTHHTLARAS
jgi:hypothetical protein